MKSRIITLLALVAIFVGCGQPAAKNANTHTHEDGSVHANHPDDHVKPDQESFEVKVDVSSALQDTINHGHHHDHYHQHDDGKPHKH